MTCPFTGLVAKYRHPETMIPYATTEAYREIQALQQNRYIWSAETGCWMGGEEDVFAEGIEEVEGWREAVHGGWMAGLEMPGSDELEEEDPSAVLDEPEPESEIVEPKGKRKGGPRISMESKPIPVSSKKAKALSKGKSIVS